jgi:hypothetical protein
MNCKNIDVAVQSGLFSLRVGAQSSLKTRACSSKTVGSSVGGSGKRRRANTQGDSAIDEEDDDEGEGEETWDSEGQDEDEGLHIDVGADGSSESDSDSPLSSLESKKGEDQDIDERIRM